MQQQIDGGSPEVISRLGDDGDARFHQPGPGQVVKPGQCNLIGKPQFRCLQRLRHAKDVYKRQQLYWYARAKEFDKARDHHLFSCIECGCCSYVCPSHIPLVQYYRYAKNEIWAREKEKQQAELARQRHRVRMERLEREKQEREAKLRQKAPPSRAELVVVPGTGISERNG